MGGIDHVMEYLLAGGYEFGIPLVVSSGVEVPIVLGERAEGTTTLSRFPGGMIDSTTIRGS